MCFKKVITICTLSAIFSVVAFEGSSAQQWKDISAKGRKETIWCVDVPTAEPYPSYLIKGIDSLSAVGWSSSQGVLLHSIDAGSNWNLTMFPTLFPISSVIYRSDGTKIVAGYNYLTDNGEVVFLNKNGTILKTYSFDGDSLPYSKNIFDIARVSNGFLVCGTNTGIFKYSFKDSSWKLVFRPLNDTMIFNFTRIQTFADPFKLPTKFVGLVLAEEYGNTHILYKTEDEGNSWAPVYDFHWISPQVELFGFFAPMFDQTELEEIFVSGSIADTAIIWHSSDGGKTWSEFFRQETLNNIVGLYVTGETKELIAVSDKGEIWVGNYRDGMLKKVQNPISDQFFGVRFFERFSTLSQGQGGTGSQVLIFGFGLSGSILQYNLDLIVNVEGQSLLPESKSYDEVVILNLFGEVVERYEKFEVDGAKNLDFLPSGIYFLVKKLNGQIIEIQGVINF